MPFDASTAYDEARQSADENAGYAAAGSAAMAKAFVTAVNRLVLYGNQIAQQRGASVSIDIGAYERARDKAEAWLQINDTSDPTRAPAATFASLTEFRR